MMNNEDIDWNKYKKQNGMSGKHHSEATKKRMSEVQKGRKLSEEHKKKLSAAKQGKKGIKKSEESKHRTSESMKGKNTGKKYGPPTQEKRIKISAAKQGIPYDEWCEFARDKKYCPKFTEACREACREKYGRRCFICNKTEKANGQKLSVHHVDMDKAQGCESNWKLVPLCKHHHATAHNDEIISRLGYLIKEEK